MPKGVEHAMMGVLNAFVAECRPSVMPKGVEHVTWRPNAKSDAACADLP